MRRLSLLLITTLLALPAVASQPEVITGKALRVLDGDTLVLDNHRVIRLANIDAPEVAHQGKPAQPFGLEAKLTLAALVQDAKLSITISDIDVYGRSIGVITATNSKGGQNINAKMVEAGLAWVYTQFNTDHSLPTLEAKARSQRLNIWSETTPTPPWAYRHSK